MTMALSNNSDQYSTIQRILPSECYDVERLEERPFLGQRTSVGAASRLTFAVDS